MADNNELWKKLAAPLNPKDILTKDSIRYITAWTVIERLNSVCPNDWHFDFEVIAVDDDTVTANANGERIGTRIASVKGYLTIAGLTRASVGLGDFKTNQKGTMLVFGGPYKQAQSDALKRCAVMFGIGLELYKEVVHLHWTKTQDWQKFYIWAKGLNLTNEDVHDALECASAKDFRGTKAKAVELLENYAHAKNEALREQA